MSGGERRNVQLLHENWSHLPTAMNEPGSFCILHKADHDTTGWKESSNLFNQLWILCFPFTIWLFLQRHVEPDISLSLSTSYLMFFKISVHSKAWDGIDCGFWCCHIQALILVIKNVNFQISGQLWNARHMIFRYLDNNEMLNIFRYGESQNVSRVWGSWSLNAIHFGGFLRAYL